jgi:hypothetical protein
LSKGVEEKRSGGEKGEDVKRHKSDPNHLPCFTLLLFTSPPLLFSSAPFPLCSDL